MYHNYEKQMNKTRVDGYKLDRIDQQMKTYHVKYDYGYEYNKNCTHKHIFKQRSREQLQTQNPERQHTT